LLQLLFLKPPDFLVLAFGDGGKRQNFRSVDLMFVGDFSGRGGRWLISALDWRTQPMPCRDFFAKRPPSILLIFNETNLTDQWFAGVVVNPFACLVPICQTAETFALNLDGDGKRQGCVSLSK
jgi:hypothetical protein